MCCTYSYIDDDLPFLLCDMPTKPDIKIGYVVFLNSPTYRRGTRSSCFLDLVEGGANLVSYNVFVCAF